MKQSILIICMSWNLTCWVVLDLVCLFEAFDCGHEVVDGY
jgi:hypothetical protein